MLTVDMVRGICHHLLRVSGSNTLILCKAVDIKNIVNPLVESNPDLIYSEHSRVLRSRTKNSKLRFITSLSFGSLKGIHAENIFYVVDVDTRLVEKVKEEFPILYPFSIIGG